MFNKFYSIYSFIICAFITIVGILDFSLVGLGVALYGLFMTVIAYFGNDIDYVIKQIMYVDNY